MCQFVFCDILQCDTPQCWGPVEWKLKYKITKHHPEYCCICSKTLNTHDTLTQNTKYTPFSWQKEKLTNVSLHLNVIYESKKCYLEILFIYRKCIFGGTWNYKFAIQTYEWVYVHVHNMPKSCTRDFRSWLALKQSTCIPGLNQFWKVFSNIISLPPSRLFLVALILVAVSDVLGQLRINAEYRRWNSFWFLQ